VSGVLFAQLEMLRSAWCRTRANCMVESRRMRFEK
jgi:hypothetical protein